MAVDEEKELRDFIANCGDRFKHQFAKGMTNNPNMRRFRDALDDAIKEEIEFNNYLRERDAEAAKLEPVDGDFLPPVGSKVWIELASSGWDEQTVTGYYVWTSHGLDKNLHRVFVRVKDVDGIPNARLLSDIRLDAEAAKGGA